MLIACGGSTWDQAVDRANQNDQPLVVEFYATWCAPCHWFEEKVLSDAEVQAALGTITFERLDFDSTAGRHHARRLGVSSVPTLVAVNREGAAIGVLKGAPAKPRFLEFLQWATEKYRSAEVIENSRTGAPVL